MGAAQDRIDDVEPSEEEVEHTPPEGVIQGRTEDHRNDRSDRDTPTTRICRTIAHQSLLPYDTRSEDNLYTCF